MPWLLIIAGVALLTFGGDSVVRGAARLAKRAGVPAIITGLTIIAFGLSSPVLFVALNAALSDRGDLAIGSVVGSNILNIGCIFALCAIIYPLRASIRVLHVGMPVALVTALAATVVLADGRLAQAEAALLIGGFIVTTLLIVRHARREQELAVREEFASAAPELKGAPWADLAWIGGGLLALALGGRALVNGAASLARAAAVSEAVIALTVVAIGTSLPVLSASLVAALRRQPDIAIGTLLGSTMFTTLGALGVAGWAAPLRAHDIRELDLGVMVGFTVLLLPFMNSGFRLQRWQGAMLLAAYVVYVAHLVGATMPG